MMLYGDDKKWFERPLACLLGFHKFSVHPSGANWVVCSRCDGEKEMK